jgi:hypothetical protein
VEQIYFCWILEGFSGCFCFFSVFGWFLFFETRCKLDVACSCEPLQRTWIGGSDFLKTRNRRFGFLQQWEFPGDFLYNEMNSPQVLSHKKIWSLNYQKKPLQNVWCSCILSHYPILTWVGDNRFLKHCHFRPCEIDELGVTSQNWLLREYWNRSLKQFEARNLNEVDVGGYCKF